MFSKDILSKENSLILRGLAIMVIMLHNFIHNPQLGFSIENEMSFSKVKADHFWSVFTSDRLNAYELFSFLGWTGVVVFVFLTGYGLAKTAPSKSLSDIPHYLKKRYLKLLALLLPAMLVFTIGDIVQHDIIPTLPKRLTYLTMMANVVYPWVNCPPGVYWYFGLTFQFYLIYAFWGRYFHRGNLIVWSLLSIIGTGILCSLQCPELLSVYKHCFTGWFVVFAIGIWCGQQSEFQMTVNHSFFVDLLLLLITIVLMIVMSNWMLTWLLVPIVALAAYFACGLLIMRSIMLKNVFIWIGGLSASIFVCHPIVRFVINRLMLARVDCLFVVVLTYIVITLIVATLYNTLYKKIIGFIK